MSEQEYKESKSQLKAQYDTGVISWEEYTTGWNKAESKFGVSLSEWPCDPDEPK
jgi:hypothetical protein